METRLACLVLCLCIVLLIGIPTSGAGRMWAKGNLHTHTELSDGDSSPQAVADWHRQHGYQFLVISDHQQLTLPASIKVDPNAGFVLIPGEELDYNPGLVIDTGAIGNPQVIKAPIRAATTAESLQRALDTIRKFGAIPMINHPNYDWAYSWREILPVTDPYFLEIFNGHPGARSAGDIAHLSIEQVWDVLLSHGRKAFATAGDDAHTLKEWGPGVANPGRGWVYVRTTEITPQAILASLRRADFYCSTGVELDDYSFDGKTFQVRVLPKPDRTYTIRFIGKWGAVLQETDSTSASYTVKGRQEKDAYIRCKVISSEGDVAWTQAFRFGRQRPVRL